MKFTLEKITTGFYILSAIILTVILTNLYQHRQKIIASQGKLMDSYQDISKSNGEMARNLQILKSENDNNIESVNLFFILLVVFLITFFILVILIIKNHKGIHNELENHVAEQELA